MVGYGRTRPTHVAGAGARSPCSSCSTTKRARELRAGRRSRFGDVPVGDRRPPSRSASPHEHGVALRVRLAGPDCGACCGLFDRPRPAADRLRAWPGRCSATPRLSPRSRELGHEIACHGLRWISYQDVDEDTERAHMAEAVAILTELTGAPRSAGTPAGTRRTPAIWSSSTAGSSTTRTPTPTTCPTGCGSGQRDAPRRALHARHQRHALRHAAGLQHR